MWATHSGVCSLPTARAALPWTSDLRSELEPGEEPQASSVRSAVSFVRPFASVEDLAGCLQQLGGFVLTQLPFLPAHRIHCRSTRSTVSSGLEARSRVQCHLQGVTQEPQTRATRHHQAQPPKEQSHCWRPSRKTGTQQRAFPQHIAGTDVFRAGSLRFWKCAQHTVCGGRVPA